MNGPDNPRWRGGRALSYGPYWSKIKIEVRARDQVCRSCGKTPEQNGRALDVHHLNPYRFSGDNSLDNLVALCHACHMRADDHGRAGAAAFLHNDRPKRATKREIRRLRALVRAAEARALRRESQARAIQLSDQGASLREIATALNVSHQTVANWLKGRYWAREQAVPYRARKRRQPSWARLLSCASPAR
ncbi:MAG: HNH endonuclease [Actinomycetota bacterium]